MEKLRKVDRPSGTFIVRRRRAGVEPSGGCLLGMPIWLVTRVRWQIRREKQWSVELGSAPAGRLGGLVQPIGMTLWATKGEADEEVENLIAQLDRGALDQRLPRYGDQSQIIR